MLPVRYGAFLCPFIKFSNTKPPRVDRGIPCYIPTPNLSQPGVAYLSPGLPKKEEKSSPSPGLKPKATPRNYTRLG